MAMHANVLLSMTSIPRRFEQTLPRAIASLQGQTAACPILVCLPRSYRKWGEAVVPESLRTLPGVQIFRPSMDYGPATKLLGALEYIKDRPEVDFVITCDDDILLRKRDYVAHLIRCARLYKGCAITVGGIELGHPPFRSDDGLLYRRKFRAVHAPAGFRGVVYPASRLRNSSVPFDLAASLPAGVFHDDDAYFGIVLSALGIPLIAVPGRGPTSMPDNGGSGVAEKATKDRRDNEMEIFDFAVRRGLLRIPAPQPRSGPLTKLCVYASHILTRVLG